MRVRERDPHTGHATTGHEWNGIRELNTAVPKPVWLFLAATVLFSVVWWVLMPAWPLGHSFTRGLLGADVRQEVAAGLEEAALGRSAWTGRLASEDLAALQADGALMEKVREAGHALFGNNCAACHGTGGAGGPGFPSLADGAWLWDGAPEAVFETIRVGVNSDHPESRHAQMPAFGRDGLLEREAVSDVVAYVRSLSDPEIAAGPQARRVAAGREVFAANCAACHGSDARGGTGTGAPDLADGFWLYGGDAQSIHRTVQGGRQGHMPSWEARLSEVDRRILTLYVLDLPRRAP